MASIVGRYLNSRRLGSFGSLRQFSNHAKGHSAEEIKQALHSIPEYTQFLPSRSKFPRRKIISYKSNEIFVMDLMDVSRFSRINKGYKFILVAVDAHSKKLFCKPLKSKHGLNVAKALENIIAENKHVAPKFFFTDRGETLIIFIIQLLPNYDNSLTCVENLQGRNFSIFTFVNYAKAIISPYTM